MRLEDYTADAICRAMDLAGFIEESWMQSESPTLRVVLKPSFHPELCVTVGRCSDAAMLSAVALIESFWLQGSDAYLPRESEQVSLPVSVFDEVVALFSTAHNSFDPKRSYVCADGMGSESCLVSRAVRSGCARTFLNSERPENS